MTEIQDLIYWLIPLTVKLLEIKRDVMMRLIMYKRYVILFVLKSSVIRAVNTTVIVFIVSILF